MTASGPRPDAAPVRPRTALDALAGIRHRLRATVATWAAQRAARPRLRVCPRCGWQVRPSTTAWGGTCGFCQRWVPGAQLTQLWR